ncbi:MAG: hypothetical protein H3C41_09360 [Bacteroidales bacterium]|nr:hypothetical protein [Bacteroidales bacterium]
MKHWLISIIFVMTIAPLTAQQVEAIGRLSADTVVPGQQFGFELLLKTPSTFQVKWPVFADTLSASVEVLERGAVETSKPDEQGNKIIRQKIALTTFDTGWISIPAQHIRFSPEGDTSTHYIVESNPLMLRVLSVPVDTTAAFKPIKNTLSLPLSFAEVLPWLIGLVVLAAFVYLASRWWKKRKKRSTPESNETVPGLPPHELALERLEQLRLERLWQQGQLKEYHTRLSDIVRAYIETEFPVNAVEMTTFEILQALNPLRINEEAMQKLQLALELSDLVKFAKAQPSGMENDMSLNHLADFVRESHQTVKDVQAEKTEEAL